jgi:putative ABC transport system permease protein
LAAEFPQVNAGRGVLLEPLRDVVIGGELRLTSILFLAVVGIVLLICCANVANLLLVRATTRTRELAVRTALGAGSTRLMRQLLTESLVLATIGGALGAAVGAGILDVAPLLIPEGLLPGAVTLSFDLRVVAFCAAAALLVGVLFGLVPAWQAGRLQPVVAMTGESRGVTGRGGRLRGVLVSAEVAAAVLLLCGAGLLLRTLLAVENVDRGYGADGALTMLVDPLGSQYPTPESKEQFLRSIETEVATVSGVRSIGWASTLPMGLSQFGRMSLQIVGNELVDESRRPSADYQIVSPSYFEAVELPIVAGRRFNERDTREGVQVCIVNEAFVRRHLQGRSPIGVRLAMASVNGNGGKPVVREIVGVARQV